MNRHDQVRPTTCCVGGEWSSLDGQDSQPPGRQGAIFGSIMADQLVDHETMHCAAAVIFRNNLKLGRILMRACFEMFDFLRDFLMGNVTVYLNWENELTCHFDVIFQTCY